MDVRSRNRIVFEERVIGERYTLICPPKIAEDIRSIIMEMSLFDPVRSIGRDQNIHFPVIFPDTASLKEFISRSSSYSEDLTLLQGDGQTVPRESDISPRDIMINSLADELGQDVIEMIPWKYERIGDCCVVRLPESIRSHWRRIGEAFQQVLGSRFVLNDSHGISGEFREPDLSVLIPPADGNYEVIHREGNTSYILDPKRIMFSSGNIDERTGFLSRADSISPPRLCEIPEVTDEMEITVDMFAGIGYFSIPLASGEEIARRIFSVEKNPVSYGYLKRNIGINHVQNRVIPVLGDNRLVLDDGIADRMIMGYVGGTIEFLPRAFDLMRPEGAVVHMHETVEIEKGISGLFEDIEAITPERLDVGLISGRRIKSYAPRIDHVVLDMMFIPH